MTAALTVHQGGRATVHGANELLSCIEAEGTVLTGCMADLEVLDEAAIILRAAHFASDLHRRAWEAILAIRETGVRPEYPLVAQRFFSASPTDGGVAYRAIEAMVLQSPAVTPRGVRALARAIRDAWARREVQRLARGAESRATLDTADVAEIVTELRASVDDVAGELASEQRSNDARSVMEEAVRLAQTAATNAGVGSRPSGFHYLDRLTAGLHSELVLIGARPGMGKTSLATAIAVNVARRGEFAYIASLETPAGTLGLRMACAEAGVSMHAARAGLLTQTDWDKLGPAMNELASLPMIVDDEAGVAVGELWTKCRRARLVNGARLGVVIIDYIQLLRAPRGGMSREEVVAENARALKAMAQELDCPVLALAQLNRAVDGRPDKRPQLSDLRESGELEQCARTVMFVYRQDYYRKAGEVKNGEATIIVAKQNNGPTGEVVMRFDGACLRFREIEQ